MMITLIIASGCTSNPTEPIEYSAQESYYMLLIAGRYLESHKRLSEYHADLFKKVELFKDNKELQELYYQFYLKSTDILNENGRAADIMKKINFIVEDEMTRRPKRK